MFVVQATHVATGLFLMILTKLGPFLSISQKGKKLDRLLFFFFLYLDLHYSEAWENMGIQGISF